MFCGPKLIFRVTYLSETALSSRISSCFIFFSGSCSYTISLYSVIQLEEADLGSAFIRLERPSELVF